MHRHLFLNILRFAFSKLASCFYSSDDYTKYGEFETKYLLINE